MILYTTHVIVTVIDFQPLNSAVVPVNMPDFDGNAPQFFHMIAGKYLKVLNKPDILHTQTNIQLVKKSNQKCNMFCLLNKLKHSYTVCTTYSYFC